MDVSILQHSRDSSPQQVAIAEVVKLIQGSQWPPGYQPLLIPAAVVQDGRQHKHIRWLTGLSIARLGYGSEKLKVKSDPHTVLCWSDGGGGLYVVYKYELNEGYRLEQQLRYYGRVTQWGCDYYERLTGCEADRRLVGPTRAVPLCHDTDVWYRDPAEAMPFMSKDIVGKEKNSEGVRERIPNWEEKVMTLDEIDHHLRRLVELRRNVISDRLEIRWLCDDIPRGLAIKSVPGATLSSAPGLLSSRM